MRSSGKDFLLWLFWLAIFSIISIAAIGYYSNSTKNYTYQTGITFIIIALFLVALLINISNTMKINWEFANVKQSASDSSLFKQHIKNLEQAAKNSLQVDQ